MIGIDNTSATRNRLRMSRTIASIDIPAWPPPWPIISCGDRPAGASCAACISRAAGAAAGATVGSAIGSQTWSGTDRPAQWKPQSRTHFDKSATEVCSGS